MAQDMDRRGFLKGTAWMGAAAFMAGCAHEGPFAAAKTGAPMQGFRLPPMKRIRLGLAGLGNRGLWALQRLTVVPGVDVVSIADLHDGRVRAAQKWLSDNGHAPARFGFSGENAHRQMLDRGEIDVCYVVTDWQSHVPIAREAMTAGCHAFVEVPAAFTLDDCWELVETSERTRKLCMQLENCCYGEIEMLALNLCRSGLLGDLVHGEAGYIHDLRSNYDWDLPDSKKQAGLAEGERQDMWRLRWNMAHKGNQYPTHGLGPICQYMDINRGDQFDYLVSLESDQRNFEAYAREKYGPDHWKSRLKIAMGDMNTTLIRTAKGRSILVQHDVSSPRPYSRLNTITGTRGILTDYPYRVTFAERAGDPVTHAFFDEKKAEEIRRKYRHPIWKHAGPVAATIGGHGGMDFIMDLRWAYCLQNGLPLDTDVYDLATWCSVCELSERSVRSGSRPQPCVDFTRGAWRTAAAFGIYDIDISKMPFSKAQLEAVAKGAMEV